MSQVQTPASEARVVSQKGLISVERVGQHGFWWQDLYHFLMVSPWATVIALLALMHTLVHLVFASGFLLCGDCIENARPGNFVDAYFFSVQTLYTIGYGFMHPNGLIANGLVVIESFTGLLLLAVMTGICFAKFSRPTARVLFSQNAVIHAHNGVPHLVLRIANERANNMIVEASVRVTLLKLEVDSEGRSMRRLHDLKLMRSHNPMFALTWTVMHPIDADSPLFNRTLDQMKKENDNLVVTLTGMDKTLLQTVHTQHAYTPSEIIPDADFEDVLTISSDGTRRLDFRKFHEIKKNT